MEDKSKSVIKVLTPEEFEIWRLAGYELVGGSILSPTRETIGDLNEGLIWIKEKNI